MLRYDLLIAVFSCGSRNWDVLVGLSNSKVGIFYEPIASGLLSRFSSGHHRADVGSDVACGFLSLLGDGCLVRLWSVASAVALLV